jgi:hypothetical protein
MIRNSAGLKEWANALRLISDGAAFTGDIGAGAAGGCERRDAGREGAVGELVLATSFHPLRFENELCGFAASRLHFRDAVLSFVFGLQLRSTSRRS